MLISEEVRTRFAPSPTGFMHVGNLRVALYDYLIAKQTKGKFVLRLEDTDQNRLVEGAEAFIYESLSTFGLNFDEGPTVGGAFAPYRQSERMAAGLYKKYAEELVQKGAAYYCFCGKDEQEHDADECDVAPFAHYDRKCLKLSVAEIKAKLNAGEKYVIRQKIPEGKTSFDDVLYGHIEVENKELEDMILLKSDGFPTYNFANVVDDHLMNITHVVRGCEYLSSAPKYTLLYRAFGWDEPTYIHCPHITNEEHKKLSKRSGHSSVKNLLDMGYLPETIINFVALLGWSGDSEKEIYSLGELIEHFDYKKVKKSSAVFDVAKLKWMNGEYLRAKPFEQFYALIEKELKAALKGDFDYHELAEILHPRLELASDIGTLLDFIPSLPNYDKSIFINEKLKSTPETSLDVLSKITPILESAKNWNKDELIALIKQFIESNALKNGLVLWPLRAALSGKASSAGGAYELLIALKRTESLARLKTAISRLK